MSEVPPSPVKKRRGCLGLATKSVLGCAAFSFGAIVVLILLLPKLCGGIARSAAEGAFGEMYQGKLAVGHVSLSWWGEQTIESAVLSDPEGREVARVTAVLPSILRLWKMEGPMKVAVDLDADLVADDAGVSNLQRALEPRQPRPETPDQDVDEEGADPLARLAELDVEATLTSRRLAWSDADTRRRGQPFEVRDLDAALVVKPGEPITLRASGQVVSDPPGALEIDATIHGPIEVGRPWPLGPVDAKVKIQSFSTAMVDGVAGLSGKLVEVIGPSFDLTATVARATPDQGAIEIDFSAERTKLAFAGTLEGGMLRSRDGAPVELVLGVPKGFVSDLVAPKLPEGTTVSWEEGDRPWKVTVQNLALPTSGPLDRLVADVDVDLPAKAYFENAETRAAGIRPSIEGVRLKARLAPGEPPTAHFETVLDTGERGRIVADASFRPDWMPREAKVVVEGVSMRAVDALAGQGGRLVEAIGPSIAIGLDARETDGDAGVVLASVESARLKLKFNGRMDASSVRTADHEGLELTWDPPPGFLDAQIGPQIETAKGKVEVRARAITIPGPQITGTWKAVARESAAGELTVSLPGATWTSEGLPPVTIGQAQLSARLQEGGIASFTLGVPVDAGAPGKILVEGSTEDAFGGLEAPFEVKAAVQGLATAPIDDLAGQQGVLAAALGPTLELDGQVVGAGPQMAVSVELTTPTTSLHAVVEKEGDSIRASGDQGIRLTSRPPAEALSRLLGPHLPQNASLALGESPIELSITDFSARLPAPDVDPMASLAAVVKLRIAALRYADPSTRDAKVDLAVKDLDVSARVAPKQPLEASVAATVSTAADDPGGKLQASATVPDPWFFRRPDAKLPPIDADLRLAGLPVALFDGLAGKPGVATGLLGERADVEVKAAGLGAEGGTFRAKIQSGSSTVAAAARLEKGVLVAVDEPALDVNATPTQAWLDALLGPALVPGAKVALVDAKQPLRISVTDLRVPVGGDLAQTSLRAEITAPDVEYSEPKAVVRGLRIAAEVAPEKTPSASVSARIDAEPPGEITANVRALDPPALLSEPDGLQRFRVAVDLRAKSVPTGLVDALANQAGLLVDVLGPSLHVEVHSEGISQTEGTFTASLESEQADVKCDRAGLKDGVLYVERMGQKSEAVLARAGLTPLFSSRIVGNLVPMVVDVKQAPDSGPVVLAVEDLRMPMDGDLSRLDAMIRVDLGKITYKLLPGLDMLAGGGQVVEIPEIKVPIEKGVARYEGLPIRIAGKDYPFKGTFSLVDKSFKMETQVPLSALGKNVSDKLDSARGFLDPNTLVPLELRGTWNKPKLRVGDDFLKKVVEDALKKQGGSLLEGLLKKKKD